MNFLFRDRAEGGSVLAERLIRYAGRPDATVIALPRGGLPVGAVVASRLGLGLDALPVRRLTHRDRWDLCLGAVCGPEIRMLDREAVTEAEIDLAALNDLIAEETAEWIREERYYRRAKGAWNLADGVAILVDDGIVTGISAMAAIAFLRKSRVKRVIVASPAIARAAFERISPLADEVELVIVPRQFDRVAQWYAECPRLADEEARGILESKRAPARR